MDIAVRLLLVPATILAFLAGAGGPSVGAERRTRTATRTYVAANTHDAAPVADHTPLGTRHCARSPGLGCVSFATRQGDRYIRLRVTDASTTAALAGAVQDVDDDGRADHYLRIFCGKSGRMRIPRPGVDVTVFVYEVKPEGSIWWGWWVYYCTNGGVATTGTVKATFSR